MEIVSTAAQDDGNAGSTGRHSGSRCIIGRVEERSSPFRLLS